MSCWRSLQGGLDKKRVRLDELASDELAELKARVQDLGSGKKVSKDIAKQLGEKLKEQASKGGDKRAKYLQELQRRMKDSQGEAISELTKKITRAHQSKSQRDEELDELRAEIKKLRAELREMRRRAAERDDER